MLPLALPQPVSYKPFTGAAETAVRLMLRAQYLMPLYYGMHLYEDTSIPTLATNGVALWVNPTFLAQLTRDHRVTAVAHEIGHKMLLHPTRRGERHPFIWNLAGDFVINPMLVESGFVPLSDLVIDGKAWSWCYDKKYAGMTTEAVYDALIKECETEAQRQEKKVQSGQGAGAGEEAGGDSGDKAADAGGVGESAVAGSRTAGRGSVHRDTPRDIAGARAEKRLGPMRDLVDFGDDPRGETSGGAAAPEPGQPHETPGDFEQRVRKELREAELTARMAGNAPDWLVRVIGNAEHTKILWYEILEQYIRSLSIADYSWARFSRREFVKTGVMSPDVYQPSLGGVLVLVDCSGSIGAHDFAIYSGHLKDVIEQVKPKWVECAYFDTEVKRVDKFERSEYQGDEEMMKPVGGGGTDFTWFARYVEDMEERPDVVLILSDMYGPMGREIEVPTFWLSTSAIDTAPYGTVVSIQ